MLKEMKTFVPSQIHFHSERTSLCFYSFLYDLKTILYKFQLDFFKQN